MSPASLFFALLIAHALCDFTLQTPDMARGKNRHASIANVPVGQKPAMVWQYWLSAHALIHGGAVWLLTGSVWLALAETILHWTIDFAKCENWTNPHADQGLHVACKLAWALLA